MAVPDSAKSADLVLDRGRSDGRPSRCSTGKLGASNIQVLARTHRSTTVGQSVDRDLQLLDQGRLRRQVDRADADRDDHPGGRHPGLPRRRQQRTRASAADRALLIPDIVYTGSHDGGPYGVDTSLLTFTPTGGTAIAAKNISSDASKIRNVFEVPAGVTTGTITVGGTATETFSGSTSTYTVTVAAPMSIADHFPAG